MAELIRVNDVSTIDDIMAGLHMCARYEPSPQRTASTDTLLDLLLVWAGVES